MPKVKMPVPVLLTLTLAPALLIGATFWMAGNLVPACTVTEEERLSSPDTQFDLVTFARDCGDAQPNTQATLVPPGEQVPYDAASFFSVAADADLDPQWDTSGNIVLTAPAGGDIYRQDETVAGRTVSYR